MTAGQLTQNTPIITMKTLLTLLSVVALAIPAFAQAEKEKKTAKKPAAEKPATEAPAEPKPAVDEKPQRALPMNSRADEIDAAGKSFTTKRKDGVAVKNVVTAGLRSSRAMRRRNSRTSKSATRSLARALKSLKPSMKW